MKILMLSWEYAPLSHGGLARHVQDLSEALVNKGHTLYIITQGNDNIPSEEEINGVKILRTAPVKISSNNFVDEILHLNFQMLERAIELNSQEDFDIIHGHDWLSFWAGKTLKHSLKIPLIFTIHATEYGRNQGIYNDMQRYINDLEWYAGFEAWRVIVCSNYMKNEVKGLFQIPEDKVEIIENGVNIDNYQAEYSQKFRNQYAAPEEKIIFYVGRLVREKGIQVLIQSLPLILHDQPDTKLVIAGKGPNFDNLKRQAEYVGVADRIYFTGFISDEVRNKLYRAADIAVFPSLYEPFGIVALEAMATRTPVIVSDVGGLSEFVEHGVNGFKVDPNNPGQLADMIKYVFHNQDRAGEVAKKGYRLVKENFTWGNIAQKTVNVYKEIREEYEDSDWDDMESQEVRGQEKVYSSYKY